MAFKILELKKTGWKKLDSIIESAQNAINERAPLASETVELSEQPDGVQICVKDAGGSVSGEEAAAGGGASAALYGALNGAPAVFHLLQSSPPTPVP